jgi:hypothetical protein
MTLATLNPNFSAKYEVIFKKFKLGFEFVEIFRFDETAEVVSVVSV